ncbi:sodium:solute symporter [Streptomyces oceani]|uniref:Sodium:solute symporter n=1 Tax=Streptomyces oceani TaxID=1075402 RepID=A0A1E7KJP4_9ACTN|nr:sodium:solute symporter [Streptomyces oceani]OEV04130.1 sodium:solute symporter [Streptomyces oceani]
MGNTDISYLDVGIVGLYIVLTLLIGVYVGKRKKSADEYFLAGRSLTWPVVGFSLYATNLSGASFIGLAGAGYSSGLAFYSHEWVPALILIVFVVLFLPFYMRSGVSTLPEFLERRYDERSRVVLSGFTIVTNVFIDCAIALYAGALVFQAFFPHMPLWLPIVVMAVLTGVYTVFGGLKSVAVNDVIQAIVFLVGGAIVFFAALAAIPSWDAVERAAPGGELSIFQPADDAQVPWPGVFTGLVVIGIYFWCTNQVIVQRTLGAKSLDHGRNGALFGGFLKLTGIAIMILPGSMALVLYPDLSNPDEAFPTLTLDLLPSGLRGVVLAAVLAGIMSTVAGVLNSASTLLTMDFVAKYRPRTAQRTLVLIGRATAAGVIAVSTVWATQMHRFGTLFVYLQSVLSYLVPPIVAVFLFGLLWKRTTRHGAFWTLLSGLVVGAVGLLANEVYGMLDIQALYAAAILFVGSSLVLVTVSLATEPLPDDEVAAYVWRPQLWRDESRELAGKPWYVNYRVYAALLFLTTLGVVVTFA